MKQKTRWHDALVLAAVLCAAFLIVTWRSARRTVAVFDGKRAGILAKSALMASFCRICQHELQN